MRFTRHLLFLFLLLGVGFDASALDLQRIGSAKDRVERVVIDYLEGSQINDPTLAATASTASSPAYASGRRGLIVAATLASVTGGAAWGCPNLAGTTCTSSIGVLPYPARLLVQVFDSGGGSTVACTNSRVDASQAFDTRRAKIVGFNQFGEPVSETIPALTEEAPFLTKYAYEKVTRVDVTGCSGGGTGDALFVAATTAVALPVRVNVSQAAFRQLPMTVCRISRSATYGAQGCIDTSAAIMAASDADSDSTINAKDTDVTSLVFDPVSSTIDFGRVAFPDVGLGGLTTNRHHKYIIRLRAPTTGF